MTIMFITGLAIGLFIGAMIGVLIIAIVRTSSREEKFEEALYRIVEWSEAYPPSVFPEPDLKKAHTLLKAGGMTLDSISADAMRHVVKGVGKIAREALE